MTTGLLDFFTLEASEYVEHLDGLVAKAAGGPPELEGFIRSARALRGSATMAKVSGIADVAAAIERVTRAVQSGQLAWDAAVRGATVSAIDDLKILIRAVRTWGDAQTSLAAMRTQELGRLAPASVPGGAAAPNASAFLASEASEIARRLTDFANNPVGPSAFADTLQRVRGLRGIALIKDLPPLPEVVDALDQAAKTFELGGAVTPALRALFATAANVLADGSLALLRGEHPATASEAITAFAAAAAAYGGSTVQSEDVVPISALFPDDGEPGLVSASPNPPTSTAQRFRMEVASHAEHLRRLVADATRAVDAATRERLGRELGTATHSLSRMAASFGESPLAAFFAERREQAALMARSALDALDRACGMLASTGGASTSEILRQVTNASPAPAPVHPTVPAPVPSPAPAPVIVPADTVVPIESLAPAGAASLVAASAAPASSGDALHAMLERGLAGLSGLDDAPLAAPAEFPDDAMVPIEDLVYRGRDALDRAIELRDAIRVSAGTPDPQMLAELFDLLELAATTD